MAIEKDTNNKNTEKTTPVVEVQNFDTPKGATVEEMVASQMAKVEAKLKAQFGKAQSNSISLGVTVLSLEPKQGAEMKDKNTGEILVDNWGNPRRYKDKYFVTFSFNGGTMTQELKENLYNQLAINRKYFAMGTLAPVSSFGETVISPVFTQFEALDI